MNAKLLPPPQTKKVKVKQYIKNKTKILIVKYKKPAYPSPTHHKKKEPKYRKTDRYTKTTTNKISKFKIDNISTIIM